MFPGTSSLGLPAATSNSDGSLEPLFDESMYESGALPPDVIALQMTPDGDEWWVAGQSGLMVLVSVGSWYIWSVHIRSLCAEFGPRGYSAAIVSLVVTSRRATSNLRALENICSTTTPWLSRECIEYALVQSDSCICATRFSLPRKNPPRASQR